MSTWRTFAPPCCGLRLFLHTDIGGGCGWRPPGTYHWTHGPVTFACFLVRLVGAPIFGISSIPRWIRNKSCDFEMAVSPHINTSKSPISTTYFDVISSCCIILLSDRCYSPLLHLFIAPYFLFRVLGRLQPIELQVILMFRAISARCHFSTYFFCSWYRSLERRAPHQPRQLGVYP